MGRGDRPVLTYGYQNSARFDSLPVTLGVVD
nr:MAG TPA: hypothetical protein [Caudoviricetes sp.]